MLHIGRLIDQKRRERHMTQQQLADKMGRYITGVVRLMKENASMDTATLLEFCVALEYNFFEDIAREADFVIAREALRPKQSADEIASYDSQ